jgi:hypothetical protein
VGVTFDPDLGQINHIHFFAWRTDRLRVVDGPLAPSLRAFSLPVLVRRAA